MKRTLLIPRLALFVVLGVSSATLRATLLRAQQEQSQQQKEDEIRGAPAEPDNAAEVRAQIAAVEKLTGTYVDRGAALYFLAATKMHFGETREAMELLKQCVALDEGFDPSGSSEFA